jgi:hypothetical protein
MLAQINFRQVYSYYKVEAQHAGSSQRLISRLGHAEKRFR